MRRNRFLCFFLATALLATSLCSILIPTAYAASLTSTQIQEKIDAYYSAVKTAVGAGAIPHWNTSQSEAVLRQYADSKQYGMSVKKAECVGTLRETGCVSNTFGGARQCFGFAKYMCYVIFGNYPQYASGQELVSGYRNDNSWSYYMGGTYPGLQPGDMIRFWYYTKNSKGETVTNIHAAVVYSVSQGKINVIDCNHSASTNGKCKIDKCSPITEKKFQEYFNAGTAYICRNKSVAGTTSSSGNTSITSNSSFGTATTGVADSITQTSAILRGSVSASGAKAEECGMYFGTSAGKLTKLGSDLINTYGTTMFYSTDKYIEQDALDPNTTYYYCAYVTVNGKEYPGDVKSFKTLPASASTPTPTPTSTPIEDESRGIAFPIVAVGSITSNSAHVASTCSYTGTRPSSVGVYLGTSTNNMTKRSSDKINHSKNPFDIWYDLSGLAAGTTYYYKFYAIVDGYEIVSGTKNFTTTDPTAINPFDYSMSGITASDITTSSVKLSATCSYTSFRPSSVGVYLGTSPSNMTVKGSDNNITHNKNPFDIWYNLGGLSAGTTYYYRFYTVVGDKTLLTDIKTFTTDDLPMEPEQIVVGTPSAPNSSSYPAVVTTQLLSIFDSVDQNAKRTLFTLKYGNAVTVYPDTEVKSGSYRWVKISHNGSTGYTNIDYLAKVTPISLKETEPYYATVNAQIISVNNDPMVDFTSLGSLKSGTRVLVDPRKQAYSVSSYTWVYIQSDSVSGYVNLNLLKKVN